MFWVLESWSVEGGKLCAEKGPIHITYISYSNSSVLSIISFVFSSSRTKKHKELYIHEKGIVTTRLLSSILKLCCAVLYFTSSSDTQTLGLYLLLSIFSQFILFSIGTEQKREKEEQDRPTNLSP